MHKYISQTLNIPTESQICADCLINLGDGAGRHMGARETRWWRAHGPKPGARFRYGAVRYHESGWIYMCIVYIYIHTYIYI